MCGSTSEVKAANPLDALPDFADFNYEIAVKPAGSKLRAWSKLEECERRLKMYEWTELLVDPLSSQKRHRILLDDTMVAFILSFETTIQLLKDQHNGSNSSFWVWLENQGEYDVQVRGMRTLRHLEAHVEHKGISKHVEVTAHVTVGVAVGMESNKTAKRNGTKDSPADGMSGRWQLPQLQNGDLAKLRQPPPIPEVELPQWNALVTSTDASKILRKGLEKLKGILLVAESDKAF
jgi:hypothetical protein